MILQQMDCAHVCFPTCAMHAPCMYNVLLSGDYLGLLTKLEQMVFLVSMYTKTKLGTQECTHIISQSQKQTRHDSMTLHNITIDNGI